MYSFQQNCAGYTREIKSLEMTDYVLCRRRQSNQTVTPSRVLPWNPGARLEAVASHGVFKIYHGLSIKTKLCKSNAYLSQDTFKFHFDIGWGCWGCDFK